MQLPKYSFGMGDRFAHQGEAQLRAVVRAKEEGADIAPVWNKSNREHQTVGSTPAATWQEAAEATAALGWEAPYFVDADHINLTNVEPFVDQANFFTIDVADYIGQPVSPQEVDEFVMTHFEYVGDLAIPGIEVPFEISEAFLRKVAEQYLGAAKEAGKIYRYLAERKGEDGFVAEVSMDEVPAPQTPPELLFILSMLAREHVKAQTIAPKFSGRFNKGVDYVGNVEQFALEFEADVAVIAFAVKKFGLPANLKLSVHTGSDKFSLYPEIHRIIRKHDAGVHLKTAGTTWLEELIGLAAAGGEALEMTKEMYQYAHAHYEELTKPYANVIDVSLDKLPDPKEVSGWSADQMVHALEHDPHHPQFNSSFRQLMHTAYKLAAQRGEQFYRLLKEHRTAVGKRVTYNLLERHIRPLFLGK
ncbi:tagaturonate epimerase [Catalinimonas alkaloidigena]|uniref:Tagaturonate/fructuronate epimerase n=1 Tax=Catalinimonas alkaloidigena TaxID=1075417 RepID=A0A1G9H8L4_9BACT|nr:tagaturonate epimerase family protein [Catalinimonas alkaloidigena]SDL09195.1 tagaturonate epimerase [Catalinimonas alkaloidigena]